MALIPGMENLSIDVAAYISQIMYWVGIVFVSLFVLAIMYGLYHFMSFRIKATEFPLYGSGTDGIFSIGKPKKNMIKWVNKRTAWRSLYPLFNKIDREPFDSEFIYPGNRIFVFSLNNQWSPGRINIKQSEGEIRGEVNPVPFVVRNWQSLTHKKNAMEFAVPSFWEQNKMFIMTVVCCVICLAACVATIYFTYKFATGGVAASNNLADAIRNFGTIPGR